MPFRYHVDEEKNRSTAGPSAWSWRVLPTSVGSLWGLRFPPHPRDERVRGVSNCQLKCMSVGVCGCPAMEGRPVQGGTRLHPQLPGEAPAAVTLHLNKWVGKYIMTLLISIHLS